MFLLSVIRASLLGFLDNHQSHTINEAASDSNGNSNGNGDGHKQPDDRTRISGHLFGLTALGMCILRLPREAIEAEGPNLAPLVQDVSAQKR
jgi:CLIP-associating protein 1/2